MTSANAFHVARQVHSATKISDFEQNLSICDRKVNSRAQCASASCYSSRGKLKYSENEFNYETVHYLRSKSDNNKKVFLQACQILAKIKVIEKKYDFDKLCSKDKSVLRRNSNTFSCNLKLNVRKLNLYYDLLRRLLEERCILLLSVEINACIKKVLQLIMDLKRIYSNEIIKLATLPINAYNRFIDSSGLSISDLEHLFRKVNFICDLHSSSKNNYQTLINFFHVSFDIELNQMLQKIYKLQNQLYSKMFYWTRKILEIFILKLCLADPDSISPECLNHILKTCESFNLLLLNKKQVKYIDAVNSRHVLFNSVFKFDYEILLGIILQHLSHFEAKVAAEKIIHFLIYECKNHGQVILNEKQFDIKKDIQTVNSITSDYYSESPTIVEGENSHFISACMNNTFENVFVSFIQRNQSLILKYLYSLTSSDMSTSTKSLKNENCDYSTGSKVWKLPHSGANEKSFHYLEERYWTGFWEKILMFCLKLTLEVPCHQYGNAAVGVFLFWPYSYHRVMFKILKLCTEVRDIPVDGSDVMKKIYNILYILSVHDKWDKNMASALSIIHGHYCMPIPTASDTVRTRIGNSLCSCVETLKDGFLNGSTNLEYPYLKLAYPLQMTLDCFISLTNIKARAAISSDDLSSYLLICRSDCVYVCNLLEGINPYDTVSQYGYIRIPSNSQKSSLSDQTQVLAGHVSEASNLIYKIISDRTRETTLHRLNKRYRFWINFNNSFNSNNSLNEVLNSVTGYTSHVYDEEVIISVISAVGNELQSLLRGMQKNLSPRKVKAVKDTFYGVLNWLEQLNIEAAEIEKLKDINCLKKLLDIIHILESPVIKQANCERCTNKVAPLITADDSTCPHESLSEEEKIQWYTSRNTAYHSCFCL